MLITLEAQLIDKTKFAFDRCSSLAANARNGRMPTQLQMERAAPCSGKACLKGQAKLNPAVFSLLKR